LRSLCGKVGVDQLHDRLLALELGNARTDTTRIQAGPHRELVLGVTYRAGTGINVAPNPGLFGDVAEYAGAAALKMKFLLGENSAMGSLREAGQKIT
jgi:hypothetical protein